MSQPAQRPAFTYDDYLEWEQRQPERHEYVRGEVFAMADNTDRHNEISGNFAILLRQHLRGTPCRLSGDSINCPPSDTKNCPP